MEQVILINEQDQEIGAMEKIEAHRLGLLHRAFSVCLFHENGDMLLQQRAASKYHSPGLWTNTCCGHPRPGEATIDAAQRRLGEEMGMQTSLSPAFQFVYKTTLENGLIEYELDHVFFGHTNHKPILNPHEASDWRYISSSDLTQELLNHPNRFTFWFHRIIEQIHAQNPSH
jgi:isopentenyl-diphosphate delta-isomerase